MTCDEAGCPICPTDGSASQAITSDLVNHPSHYKTPSGLEAIDVIEAFGWGFCIANAFKYLARAGKKTADPLVDLRKSVWYLNREIAHLEKEKARGAK